MAKRSDGIKKVDDIDEKEFLSILDGRATPSALPKKENSETPVPKAEEPKEEIREARGEKEEPEEKDATPKRTYKKKKNGEYIDAFLKPRVLKQRQSVYISQDVHEFISKIVNKLGIRNMTVGVFIDTVMTQHISDHADELRAIYYREEKDIFRNIVKNNEDE
ncbi:hypothetical protein M2137_001837 [Parabacteroides sp. PFB2-10]|uniref:DUF3408 domain-containing protein n=1 Tax=Parabacteroides sp. PFB2-10 TaxID=1742405 RepID=UPI002476FAD7|nr:DUF3408 domain-containing protein [Parabacteroides sp. PFB2-10]MDH6313050.1 hypothetical protein [Parabacteroides sp. PFB2-10]MDL2208399.1 DUF3408 domain-containing protein [Parabacteroides sp. OttesenSCG-928-O15]